MSFYRNHKPNLTIVKVGGAVVEDAAQLDLLLHRFATIEGRKLLVHGGGRRATAVASALGIETKMVGGRRITDADMLNVVTMVYGGLVNKTIVARMQALGIDAIGLTGADLDIIRSHKRPLKDGIDYGFVGDVDKVDASKISHFIENNSVPVIAPLTHDAGGNLLNTNADTIASETAKAMAQRLRVGDGTSEMAYDVTLVFAFEKAGVLANPDDDNSIIPKITPDSFRQLVADGTVSGGMIPKIENALAAVKAGVSQVVITRADLIGTTSGTIIRS